MNTLALITDILRKTKAFSGRVPNSAKDKAGIVEIFRELIPANVASLDPDVIDEPQDYEVLLARLAAISNGDLAPESVQIKAGRTGKLTLSFTQQQETYALKFTHEGGTYIDQSFLDALHKHCRKKLPGTFLFTSEAESIQAVYLPLKAFKRVNNELLSTQSTDALATLIQAGNVFSIGWDNIPYDVVEGFTRDGETLITALIKAPFAEKPGSWGATRRIEILEGLQGMVNVFRANAHGETPRDIALAKGWDHLVPELSGWPVKTVPVTTIRERAGKGHACFEDDLKEAFERLDEKGLFESIHFDPNNPFQHLHISHRPDFIYGEDTLLVSRYRFGGAVVGYDVFSQKRGENGWSLSRFVPLGDVDQLCEVIERYCTHSLV